MIEFQSSIEVGAPPQVVFEYLTTNEGMAAWMGQYVDLDSTSSEQFAIDVVGYPVRSEYLMTESFQRVVVPWEFAGGDELPAGASRVESILTPITADTRMDLRCLDLPEPAVPGYAHGWAHFMPCLKVAGVGGDAGSGHWQPLTD